ncbi:MAG TPA: carboxypeptidase-like regulatory domain-containing protein [Myxococcota bacterium]|nr:carboxypeptidase-like regulatory domain-containing protein [Myxococcota bacterium]
MRPHLALAVLAACARGGPASAPPIVPPQTEDTARPADTAPPPPADDTPTDTPLDTAWVPEAGVTGRITDPSGARLAGLALTMCRAACYTTRTLPNGDFHFGALPEGRYVLHNLTWPGASPPGDAQGWSSFFDFVDVPADPELDLRSTPWVVPAIDERIPLTGDAQTLTFADGALEVIVDGSLELPGSLRGAGGVTVGAVEVGPDRWPRAGLEGVTITRAFAIAPFEASAPAGFAIAVRAADADGLWVASYEDGARDGRFLAIEARRDGDVLRGTAPQLTWIIAGSAASP